MDLPYTPITFAYSLISRKYIYIFLEDPVLPKKILNFYSKKVRFVNFLEINQILKKMKVSKQKILVDQNSTSKYYYDLLQKHYKKVFNDADPVCYLKSIKNKVEIKNLVKSHIFDGVALTKFIYWFKNIKNKVSELDIVNRIDSLRAQNQEYLSKSFPTIAGSGKNGAIVHYRATKNNTKLIKKNEIFLCDSGGQYKYGTTDVTRTICFENQNKNIKNIFTNVLKGHIAVAQTDLNKKKTGKLIDKDARKFLKKDRLDYSHGTGHGVGFFLNVHEGPQSISKSNSVKIQKGMILSNEPGYYKKDKFGIRIENLVYVKKIGRKLGFENLTLAPIEKELINFNLLTKREKNYLFNYHLKVYSKISPFLNRNEKKWLASFI
jgi:Xaa-Pro aminopeptidase